MRVHVGAVEPLGAGTVGTVRKNYRAGGVKRKDGLGAMVSRMSLTRRKNRDLHGGRALISV
jgi:hypothetical protein